jgi:hypothetical protein
MHKNQSICLRGDPLGRLDIGLPEDAGGRRGGERDSGARQDRKRDGEHSEVFCDHLKTCEVNFTREFVNAETSTKLGSAGSQQR